MKTVNLVGMIVLSAGTARAASPTAINICAARTIEGVILDQAAMKASWILRPAGIELLFRSDKSTFCRLQESRAVMLGFSAEAPVDFVPGALAYTLPYEGVHIEIFWDRVASQCASRPSLLLAYVFAHEITHVLEGVGRHSDSGVMKPRWNHDDFRAMNLDHLRLAEEDVQFIQGGVKEWNLVRAPSR